MSAEAAARRIPLTEVVRVLSAELQEMGSMAERVQTTLAPALLRAAKDPAARREAQTYDRLTQLLYGVAAFVGELHGSLPVGWTVDAGAAARGVPLADLAGRLGCTARPAVPCEAGELDLL